jgi:hypothetical protein
MAIYPYSSNFPLLERDQSEVIDLFLQLMLENGRISRVSKPAKGRSTEQRSKSYEGPMQAKLRGELPDLD